MKPIRLVMTAFGPYAGEQAIDFRELGGRSFFLIHGPTGGGKTTILDAMCYALYGDTSGNERKGEQMRCQLAGADTTTSVLFDFTLGEKNYRVVRKPEQERPRKKGTGTTTDTATATLWDRTGLTEDGQEGTVLAAQSSKVTAEVERLLGFRSEQFRQVILLPQDKFRELLTADSRQREEILQALFQTEFYERIQVALKLRAKEIEQKKKELDQLQKALLEQAGAATLKDLLEQRETKDGVLKAVEAQLEPLRSAEKSAQDALTAGEQAQGKLREREESAKALAALDAQTGECRQWSQQVEAARRAVALGADERALAMCVQDAKQRKDGLAASERAFGSMQQKAAAAQAARQAEESRQPEAQRLRERAARLAALEEPVRLLEQVRKDLTASQQQVTQADEALRKLQVSLMESQRQLDERKQQLAKDQQLAAGHEGNMLAARQAGEHVRLRRELDAARKEVAAQEKTQQERSAQEQRGIELLGKAKRALDALRDARITGQAALLARDLAPGRPCPVCGSVEHPRPAESSAEIPSKEQIAAQQQEVEKLEKGLEKVRELVRTAAEALASARAIEAERVAALGELSAQPLEALGAVLSARQSAAHASEAASARLADLERACRTLERGIKQAELAIEQQRAQRQSAAETASAARRLLEATESQLPPEVRTEAALKAAAAAVDAELRRMDEALKAARQSAADAEAALAAAKEACDKAREEARRADAALAEARQRFNEKRIAAGFASDEEYRAARVTDAQVRALEERIVQHERAHSAALGRAERARQAAAGLTIPDVPALGLALKDAKGKLEQAIGQRKGLERELSQMDRWIGKLRASAEQSAEYDRQYAVYGTLADAAMGRNDLGMAFQRFVLTFLLDDVLVAATERLRIMSRGRYQLQRQIGRGDRRHAGLDLEVFDSFTGSSRAVATLSGGEGFLASLALALGLADVVQSYAGGIRMETVFIDEGFGSLDTESLDLAIRALEDLLQGGRLVGIISHVTELRERIPVRLEVTSTQAGSSARFVLGAAPAR